MTTTEPTTTDVYTALTNLSHVHVDAETRAAIDGARTALEYVEPFADHAKQVLTALEVAGQEARAHLLEGLNLNEEGDVEQALWDLMQELSGARELFRAMQELCELCDPDRMLSPSVIAETLAEEGAR